MKDFDDIWQSGIISFDTCSLGRMYEWESRYAVNIKDALSYLYSMGKVWESEINIDEFSVQREAIKNSIYEQKYEKGIFNNLITRPIPWNKIEGTLGRWERKGFSDDFLKAISKINGHKEITAAELNELEMLSKILSSVDFEELFDNILVRDSLVLTENEKIQLKQRYESGSICPGSGDLNKNNGKKYNDLYIWKLLQKKAKLTHKDIIFVTADTAKGDWFDNGTPRPEYLTEFNKETGQEIIILSLTDFWDNCKNYLDMSVDDFIKFSAISDQIQERYNVFYQEDIANKIADYIYESDDIKNELENLVDSCVDLPVFDEIEDVSVEGYYIDFYGKDTVYVTFCSDAVIGFEAINHTCGEDWSAGSDSILFEMELAVEIPVVWKSSDTDRLVLSDQYSINEITDIKVKKCQGHDNEDYCDDMSYDEDIF